MTEKEYFEMEQKIIEKGRRDQLITLVIGIGFQVAVIVATLLITITR